MNSIFISYIIPCYNVEKYLSRCFDSLEKQVIRDNMGIEFVFVNDGSTDGTLSLLQAFAARDSRAVVIDQKNQGVSSARNAGLKVAKGKYVFFLDSDDWLMEDASQIICDACCGREPDIIVTNAYIVNENSPDSKKEWNPCPGLDSGLYNIMDFANKVQRLPISFKAYGREMLEKNHITYNEELRVGEVFAFFLNAMTQSKCIAFTDKRVMNYLVRRSGVMRTINLERDSTIIKTMHFIEDSVNARMPQLSEFPSYKRSLYNIVNMFGIKHYSRRVPYSIEIGAFLTNIKNDTIYKKLQKYFIYKEFGLNGRTMSCLLAYFFPIPVAYRFLRIARKIGLK